MTTVDPSGRHRVMPPPWFGFLIAAGFLVAIMSMFVVPTGPRSAPLTALAIISAVVATLAFMTKRSTVFVGAEGLRTRFVGERFVPFSALQDVALRGRHSIELRFRSGRKELLSVAPRSDRHVTKDDEERRNALYEQVRSALAAYRSSAAPAERSLELRRNGRTAREWKEALTRHAVDPSYRAADVRTDELWRVLEDVREPEAARAGAAVALSPVLDDQGRERVRIVAEATASPHLRVALDAAADGSDEPLTEALDGLEDEDAKRGRAV